MSRRAHPRGVGMLPVVLILLFLFPLITIFLKRTGQEVRASLRDRQLRLVRNISVNPVADFMQIFSEELHGDHYSNFFLARTWGSGTSWYGKSESRMKWNSAVFGPFDEARARQERLFAFEAQALLYAGVMPMRGQAGVIQFQSDLTRYALISEADLTIDTAGPNIHPLDGQHVDSLWVKGDLSVTGAANFGLRNVAYAASTFSNDGLAVVHGRVDGAALPLGTRGFYGSAAGPGFSGAGTAIHYIPVEVSTVTPGMGDLAYFNNHGSTATVVSATITFAGANIGIDHGTGVQNYATGGISTVLVAREGANLTINLAGDLTFPLTVVTVGGGSIKIHDGVRYNGGGSANASRSFAALSSGDLIFHGSAVNMRTDGFYYCEGDIEVVHDLAAPQVITINGVLMTRSGSFDNGPNGERLRIDLDRDLRAFYPPMLPERPRLVKLQAKSQ